MFGKGYNRAAPIAKTTMLPHAPGPPQNGNPLERLSGSIERVTFHSEATGFCMLHIKVKGHRDVVTVVGPADRHCG